jgi:hypothetical protein
MPAAPQSDRVCAICFRDVLAEQRASYQHGELYHFDCYVGVPPLPSVLGHAVAQQRERPLCLHCLGQEFDLTVREVSDAIRELSVTHRFRVAVDVCWRCRQRRLTVSSLLSLPQ